MEIEFQYFKWFEEFKRIRLRFEGDKYRIENETKKGCNRFGKACNWDVYKLVPNGGSENELPLSAWRNDTSINP